MEINKKANMNIKSYITPLVCVFAVFCVFLFFACTAKQNSVYNNGAEGYSFEIPSGFTLDEGFLPASVHFVSDTTSIELYTFKGSIAQCLQYVNYSCENILANHIDYNNVVRASNRADYSVLRWERKKLARVENDKNHYAKIDITRKNTVYTILVKSTEPVGDCNSYAKLLRIHGNITKKAVVPAGKKPRVADFNDETREFYEKYFVNNPDVVWGIFHPEYMESNALDIYESKIDHEFEILQWYTAFYNEYKIEKVKDFLEKAHAEGKAVVLTLQPSWVHDEGNDFLRLLDGGYDEFLKEYINEIKSFGHPVIFRFANEMNGDWCEYCAHTLSHDSELYRLAYRYVFDLFEKYGVRNAIWVWNPNGTSFPDYSWNNELMYYPGNEYVDILGLTAYNTGVFYPGEKWKSFEELYDPLYERCMQWYDMPFMITEFSCSRGGGSKEKWTRDMLDKIKKYENINIAIWWDSVNYNDDGEIYRRYNIDDSEEMTQIFTEYFRHKREE